MGRYTKRVSHVAQTLSDADPATLARVERILAGEADPVVVDCPDRVAETVGPLLDGLDHEALVVVCLNRRRRVISARILTRGNDCFCIVCPRQILRHALRQGAHAIILAHNHPSGDPTPSEQDAEVTRRVQSAGRIIGIELLDHIVYAGPHSWRSLAQLGDMAAPGPSPRVWTSP